MEQLFTKLSQIVDLGGPVVVILLVLSVISVALAIYKFAQFTLTGVGRHRGAMNAVNAWSSGEHMSAMNAVSAQNTLAGVIASDAMRMRHTRRLEAVDDEQIESKLVVEAERRLSKLERGFRVFDSIAQIAPLLGLFGTVLGMIEAFQKLQGAGNSVDPSILAGGIWVALLTTAVGLAVAMPTSLFLTYFESRVARERSTCELIISRIIGPSIPAGSSMLAQSDEYAQGVATQS